MVCSPLTPKRTRGENVDVDRARDWVNGRLLERFPLQSPRLTTVVHGHFVGQTQAAMGLGQAHQGFQLTRIGRNLETSREMRTLPGKEPL